MSTDQPLPYLASASALIKALRAPADPPQPDWPRKISIATAALDDSTFHVPRKDQVLRDWVIDSWARTSKCLHDPAYHELLLRLQGKDQQQDSQAPVQLLSTFFQSSTKQQYDPAVIGVAARSLTGLFRNQRMSTRLENWVDLWSALLGFLLAVEPDVDGLVPLLELVTFPIAQCETTLSNIKKITQSASASFPAYCRAYARHPKLRSTLNETLSILVFPPTSLQSGNPLQPLTALVDPSAADGQVLEGFSLALPSLFHSLVNHYHKYRYTIFTQASSSKVAHDVFMANKEREAVRSAVTHLVAFLSETEAKTSEQAKLEWTWKARSSVWVVVEEWGGYMERDPAWSRLLGEEARTTESTLMSNGSKPQAGAFVGTLLLTLLTLEKLDHDQARLGPNVVRWCLASPPDHHVLTSSILSTLLRFSQLTHTLPTFFHLLISSLDGLFDASLPDVVIKSLYELIVNGPLAQAKLRREITSALRAVNVAKGRSNVWNEITGSVVDSLSSTRTGETEGDSKKRKRHAGPSPRTAAMAGIVSRLASYCLESARHTTHDNDPSADRLGGIASLITEWPAAEEQPNGPESASKSSKKGDRSSVGSWAGYTSSAARLRLARGYERLVRTKVDFDSNVEVTLKNDTKDSFEVQLETLKFIFHRSALEKQSSGTASLSLYVGGVLTLLGSASQRYGITATKTLWQIVLEEGIVLIHQCATSAQISQLVLMVCQEEAIRPWLLESLIWELPRFKDALQEIIVSTEVADMIPILDVCPAPCLSKKTRSLVIARLQKADRVGSATRWLHRIIDEGESVASLTRDTELLKSIAAAVHADDDAEQIWAKVIRHICQTPNHALVSELATYLLERDSTQAAATFCEQIMQFSKESIPEDTLLLLRKLGNKCLQSTSVVDASLVQYDHQAVARRNVFVRFGRWLGSTDVKIDAALGGRLCQAAVQSAKECRPLDFVTQLARDAMETLACDSAGTEALLAAAISLLAASPTLEISETLRAVFKDSITEALEACAGYLDQTTEYTSAVLRIVIALCVRCTSAETIRRVVRSVSMQTGQTGLIVRFVEVLAEEKATMVQSDDLARLWPLVFGEINSTLYTSIVNVLSTLSRRRPELIFATLPEIIDVLCALINALQSRRNSPDDHRDQAQSLARLLIVMAQTKSNNKRHETSPLAKHVPVLLVAYVRAAAGFPRGLTPAVRKELEPGLFALCNLATSGGRVHARGREGEGLGVPFGLGEGAAGEGEKELWAELWRSWSKSRYTGQG